MICFRRFPELSARPIHFFSLRVYCLRPQIVQCYAPSVTGRLKETSSYLEPEMTRDWCHSEMNGRNDYNVVLLSFFPYLELQQRRGISMTEKQVGLSTRLKLLGFTKGNQMKLYGEILELVSEPIVMADNVVLVDATEKKSGRSRRVRIPLPVVNMASAA